MTESLFEDVRSAEVVAPDDHSTTRFAPYVMLSPEQRDALVEAVSAAIPLYEAGQGDARFWQAMEALGV